MTCLKSTPAAPANVPVLLTLLQPLTTQALHKLHWAVVGTLDALGPDAFDAVVGAAPAHTLGQPDDAEAEYASWLPDPGAMEMASWGHPPQHVVR